MWKNQTYVFINSQTSTGQPSGWIEVICGSMFSGKTEELIRRLKRAKIANQKVQIFKPSKDTRYDIIKVVSHDENAVDSLPISQSEEIFNHISDVNVVGIDEAQFFDENLPLVCQKLAIDGVRVIIAGLDMDFKGRPFGPIPNLLAVAEYITKVHAICPHCGNLGVHILTDLVKNKKRCFWVRKICMNRVVGFVTKWEIFWI